MIGYLNKIDSFYRSSEMNDHKLLTALYGFSYIIEDYYVSLLKRFAKKGKINRISEVFQYNIRMIVQLNRTKKYWYAPAWQRKFYDTIFTVENRFLQIRYINQSLDKQINIFTDFHKEDSFESYLLHFLESVHRNKLWKLPVTSLSIGSGQAGLILFSFYYSKISKEDAIGNTDIVKNAFRYYKNPKLYTYTDDYFYGMPGLIIVLENIKKNKLLDSDVSAFFKDVDTLVLNHIRDVNKDFEDIIWNCAYIFNRISGNLSGPIDSQKKMTEILLLFVDKTKEYLENHNLYKDKNSYYKNIAKACFMLQQIAMIGINRSIITEIMLKIIKNIEEFCVKPCVENETLFDCLFSSWSTSKFIDGNESHSALTRLNSIASVIKNDHRLYTTFSLDKIRYIQQLNILCKETGNHFYRQTAKHELKKAFDKFFPKDVETCFFNNGLFGLSGLALLACSCLSDDCFGWEDVILLK